MTTKLDLPLNFICLRVSVAIQFFRSLLELFPRHLAESDIRQRITLLH